MFRNSKKKRKQLLDRITEQLKKDIPVPIMLGANDVTLYSYSLDNEELIKGYKYNLHWVVILDIKFDYISGKTMMTVASWGEKYKIDFDDFYENGGILSTVTLIQD